ncbi:MAG: DUF5103 domain-containing protein [Bacteroidales bacterium]|nr:DUF5103 domain-containing protein [Bacteroidales bacterium]
MSLTEALGAQSVFTHSLDPNLKTLQVIADGDFQKLPVIGLDGNSSITVSFDYLADEQAWIDYTVVHCNARWQPDDLSEMDYLEYRTLPLHVEDIEPSFNTFTNYFHYEVKFPNDDVQPAISGNYAIIFHVQDEPDSVLAVAAFSVTEQLVFANGTVSGNTDIDFQQLHQQLTLGLSWSESHLSHMDAASELLVHVQQNHRRDNERWIAHPTRMEKGKAFYEHEKQLIFEAGNHWRRFEFIDERYPGLHVDHVRYHAPIYYAYLNRDLARNQDNYRYDQDQHGKYKIHALRVDDVNIEAEYFMAMFSLDAPAGLSTRGVYLVGDLTSQVLDETTRMDYDPNAGLYFKELLLKEGAYNYQYLVPVRMQETETGEEKPLLSTSFVEGNHYETPNEYEIFVYYCPFGRRYDRLVGTAKIY